ncbi:MAG: SurA N-terminal domain-containing protein [Akkermansia sp.]
MLEFLRKHTLVVMAAMVLVFFGLVFIESNTQTFAGGGTVIAKIGDTSYGIKDYEQVSNIGLRIAYSCPTLQPMVQELTICKGTANPGVAFLANCAIIRHEAELYGIYPSSLEIDETIKSLPDFQTKTGEFDIDRYRELISMRGKTGITEVEESFREIVGDWIRLQRLEAILTDNLSINETFCKNLFHSENQDISINLALIERSQFAPKTDPGEGEIKAFWEKRAKNYLNDESRSISLYIFKPVAPIVVDPNAKIPAATNEVLNSVENLWQKIADANANGIHEMIAQTAKEESKLFTLEKKELNDLTKKELPVILQSPLNPAAGSQQPNLAEVAFTLAPSVASREKTKEELEEAGNSNTPQQASQQTSTQPKITADNVSNALVLEDGSVALICVNSISPIRPLPYEKARSAARADLLSQMTDEALDKAGQNLRTQLAEIKGGNQFIAKAKAQGAKTSSWGPFNKIKLPTDLPEASSIFQELQKIATGNVSPLIRSDEGIIIAQLLKRTIDDTPQNRAMEGSVTGFLNLQTKRMFLADWLEACAVKYKVSFPRDIQN